MCSSYSWIETLFGYKIRTYAKFYGRILIGSHSTPTPLWSPLRSFRDLIWNFGYRKKLKQLIWYAIVHKDLQEVPQTSNLIWHCTQTINQLNHLCEACQLIHQHKLWTNSNYEPTPNLGVGEWERESISIAQASSMEAWSRAVDGHAIGGSRASGHAYPRAGHTCRGAGSASGTAGRVALGHQHRARLSGSASDVRVWLQVMLGCRWTRLASGREKRAAPALARRALVPGWQTTSKT
jgi:hypothetical protein